MKFINRTMQPALRRFFILCHSIFIACVLMMAPAGHVFADEITNARALAGAGKLAEALVVADAYLAQKPNDANMLFLKGLILTQQDQSAKAIAVFTKLTESHPAQPEPYNNLAVLYASAGQYDKARTALEMALRTNAAYATAFENLGDIYAKLASQAYDKALQTKSAAAGAKLTLVQSLGTSTPGAKALPIVIAAAPKPAPAPAAAPPAATPAAAPPAKAEPKPVSKPDPKPAAKPEAVSNAEQEEIAKTLKDWAAAWSSKDVKKYLSYYASDFKTPKNMSRKAWADERQSRIVGKGRISVKVESPQITVSGNSATVKFRQAYSSDRLSVSSRKTMVFTKSGGKWKIQQELAN